MKTIEDLTKEINCVIDEHYDDLIDEEMLAKMRKEIKGCIKNAINFGVIKAMPEVKIDVDEVQGHLDVFVGAVDEESENNIQDSGKCQQAPQTSGESIKRVIS